MAANAAKLLVLKGAVPTFDHDGRLRSLLCAGKSVPGAKMWLCNNPSLMNYCPFQRCNCQRLGQGQLEGEPPAGFF